MFTFKNVKISEGNKESITFILTFTTEAIRSILEGSLAALKSEINVLSTSVTDTVFPDEVKQEVDKYWHRIQLEVETVEKLLGYYDKYIIEDLCGKSYDCADNHIKNAIKSVVDSIFNLESIQGELPCSINLTSDIISLYYTDEVLFSVKDIMYHTEKAFNLLGAIVKYTEEHGSLSDNQLTFLKDRISSSILARRLCTTKEQLVDDLCNELSYKGIREAYTLSDIILQVISERLEFVSETVIGFEDTHSDTN